MADEAVVKVGENTPEGVAYKLFRDVAYAEGKKMIGFAALQNPIDKQWILDTYAECLTTVRSPQQRFPSKTFSRP